jgi:hypothetical protein
MRAMVTRGVGAHKRELMCRGRWVPGAPSRGGDVGDGELEVACVIDVRMVLDRGGGG